MNIKSPGISFLEYLEKAVAGRDPVMQRIAKEVALEAFSNWQGDHLLHISDSFHADLRQEMHMDTRRTIARGQITHRIGGDLSRKHIAWSERVTGEQWVMSGQIVVFKGEGVKR